uniref:Uncharacterized protein n=1 Tax=Salix viminalis TaxID=40686 RepID=A0A6N2LUB2_SALVM
MHITCTSALISIDTENASVQANPVSISPAADADSDATSIACSITQNLHNDREAVEVTNTHSMITRSKNHIYRPRQSNHVTAAHIQDTGDDLQDEDQDIDQAATITKPMITAATINPP